jgi:hypothetical protein
MISKDNSRTMITIPNELKLWLVQQATKESRSLSNYILVILQKHREQEEGYFTNNI